MKITADQFVTRSGRRVLTDDGQQGMGGEHGRGSTTEKTGSGSSGDLCKLR